MVFAALGKICSNAKASRDKKRLLCGAQGWDILIRCFKSGGCVSDPALLVHFIIGVGCGGCN